MSDSIRQTVRVSSREHHELYLWLLDLKTADESWSDTLRRALTIAMECSLEGSQLTRIERAVERVEQQIAQLKVAPVVAVKAATEPEHTAQKSTPQDNPFGGGFGDFA